MTPEAPCQTTLVGSYVGEHPGLHQLGDPLKHGRKVTGAIRVETVGFTTSHSKTSMDVL